MISETAEIIVRPGPEFEAAVVRAVPLFRAARGRRHMRLKRSVEEPGKYRLLFNWDTLADHVEHFRSSPAFARWRELVSPYFARPPDVGHGEIVFDAF